MQDKLNLRMKSGRVRRWALNLAAGSLLAVGCTNGSLEQPVNLVFQAQAVPYTVAENVELALEQILDVTPNSESPDTTVVAISGDQTLVAYGDETGSVRIYDLASQSEVFSVQVNSNPARWVGTVHEEFADDRGGRITGIAFSANSDRVLVATAVGTVARYVVATGSAEFSTEVANTISAFDADSSTSQIIVGTDQGAFIEYGVPAFNTIHTYRPADGKGEATLACYVNGDEQILTGLTGYQLADDAESTPPGTVFDAGLTRWSTNTYARLWRYATAADGADFYTPTGETVAGTCDNAGKVFEADGTIAFTDDAALSANVGFLTVGSLVLTSSVRAGDITIRRALEQETSLHYVDGGRHFTPRAFDSASSGGVFAVGRQGGGVTLYRVVSAPTQLVARAVDKTLGTAFGVDFKTTRELVGHRASVVEASVSPTGRYIATRDSEGNLIVWDDVPADAMTGTAIELPIGTGSRQSVARLSYSQSEDALVVVLLDGTLRRVPLPAMTPVATINVVNGTTPISVLAALEVNPTSLMIAGRDNSLYIANASTGAVTKTVVAATGVTGERPFTELVRWPDNTHVVAAPAYATVPGAHALSKIRISDWAVVSTMTEEYRGGRIAPAADGLKLLLGEQYKRAGMVVLDFSDLSVGFGQGKIAPWAGFGSVTSTLVMGSERRNKLRIFQMTSSGFDSAAVVIDVGDVWAFGSSKTTSRAYLGLASGTVLEITAQ